MAGFLSTDRSSRVIAIGHHDDWRGGASSPASGRAVPERRAGSLPTSWRRYPAPIRGETDRAFTVNQVIEQKLERCIDHLLHGWLVDLQFWLARARITLAIRPRRGTNADIAQVQVQNSGRGTRHFVTLPDETVQERRGVHAGSRGRPTSFLMIVGNAFSCIM